MYDVTALEKRMTAFVIPNAILVTTTQQKYTFTSFLSRDNTHDVIYNVWRLARPGASSALPSPRASLDMPDSTSDVVASAKAAVVKPKATICECGRKGEHFSEVAMESVLPGTPEKVYNLLFTSGFIKDFMTQEQNLTGQPVVSAPSLADADAMFPRAPDFRLDASGGGVDAALPPNVVHKTAQRQHRPEVCQVRAPR